jgi:tetratricopeptide (TPR) repeat protein
MLFAWIANLSRRRLQSQANWAFYHDAGVRAYQAGRYRQAKRRFLAALKTSERQGIVHRRSASTLNNLGLLYKRRRHLRQAEVYLKRALQVYEVTAPKCRQLASVLYHLATVCHAQRQYTEAESLYQRCIVLTTRTFGENHPKLAKRLRGYALLLEHTNRPGRAAKLQARARVIREQRAHA